MKKITIAWSLAAALLAPVAAGAQQDPALIGEGAQVYAANCGRCHNARASTERTDAEWAIIVNHMRARGNLTKSQAKAVLAYLQATNLPESSSGAAAAAQAAETPSPGAAGNVVMPTQLRDALVAAGRAQAGARHRGEDPGGS